MKPILRIVNYSFNDLPEYETEGSAGMDLRASEKGIVEKGKTELISTNLYIAVPKGYVGDVRPRSGLALRDGITVLNAPGTIDCDYRGEVSVILHNTSKTDFPIERGDRIAQLVLVRITQAKIREVEDMDDLGNTSRGTDGFGSTGKS